LLVDSDYNDKRKSTRTELAAGVDSRVVEMMMVVVVVVVVVVHEGGRWSCRAGWDRGTNDEALLEAAPAGQGRSEVWFHGRRWMRSQKA